LPPWLPFFSSSSGSLEMDEGLEPAPFIYASNMASFTDLGLSIGRSWGEINWPSVSSYCCCWNCSNWAFQSVPTLEFLEPTLLEVLASDVLSVGLEPSKAWEMRPFLTKFEPPMLDNIPLSTLVFLSALST
jgi:hypothetical protein